MPGAVAIRSRPASTSMTKASPIQNSQYSGVAAEITSLRTMNAAAPMSSSVKISRATDNQHQHDVSRSMEVEQVERHDLRRLRQQRARP